MTASPATVSWEVHSYPRPNLRELRKFCASAIEIAGLEMNGQILPFTFLDSDEMAEINLRHLNHIGDTDVITFDYRSDFPFPDEAEEDEPLGEIFICPAVAERQSQGRCRRSYSRELALYVVHGVLHLRGEDDLSPVPRARMRRQERRVITALSPLFNMDTLFPSKS